MLVFSLRIRCESGICKSPLKITSSQWLASELFPEAILKAILYPGTVLNSIIEHQTLPTFNDLLKSFDMEEDPAPMDFQDIEVCYFMSCMHKWLYCKINHVFMWVAGSRGKLLDGSGSFHESCKTSPYELLRNTYHHLGPW